MLQKLVGIAKKNHVLSNELAVYNSLLEREKLGHVSNASGVALPHSRIKGIKEPQVFCAILQKPFVWDNEDGFMVHTVFLILTPYNKPQMHLSVLKSISMFCKQSNLSQALYDLMTPVTV